MQAPHCQNCPSRYHWLISEPINEHLDTFIQVTKLISMKGKQFYFPIPFHSMPHLYYWKLHCSKGRFQTNINFPFSSRGIVGKQTALVEYSVFNQNNSCELTICLFGLHNIADPLVNRKINALEDYIIRYLGRLVSSGPSSLQQPPEISMQQAISILSNLLQLSIVNAIGVCELIRGLARWFNENRHSFQSENKYWLLWILHHLLSLHLLKSQHKVNLLFVFDLFNILFNQDELVPSPPQPANSFTLALLASIHLYDLVCSKMTPQETTPLPASLGHLWEYSNQLKIRYKSNRPQVSELEFSLLLQSGDTNERASCIEALVRKFAGHPINSQSSESPIEHHIVDIIGPMHRLAFTRYLLRALFKPAIDANDGGFVCYTGIESLARLIDRLDVDHLPIKDTVALLTQFSENQSISIGLFNVLAELCCYRIKWPRLLAKDRLKMYHVLTKSISKRVCNARDGAVATQMFCIHGFVWYTDDYDLVVTVNKQSETQKQQFIALARREMGCYSAMSRAMILRLCISCTRFGFLNIGEMRLFVNFIADMILANKNPLPNCLSRTFSKTIRDVMAIDGLIAPAAQYERIQSQLCRFRSFLTAPNISFQQQQSSEEQMHPYLLTERETSEYRAIFHYLLDDISIQELMPFAGTIYDRMSVADECLMINNLVDYIYGKFSNLTLANDSSLFRKVADALSYMIHTCKLMATDQFCMQLFLQASTDENVHLSIELFLHILSKWSSIREAIEFMRTPKSRCFPSQCGLGDDWLKLVNDFNGRFRERTLWQGIRHVVDGSDASACSSIRTQGGLYTNFVTRLIPVFDILIHHIFSLQSQCHRIERFVEFGHLYRFHLCPIRFVHEICFLHRCTISGSQKIANRFFLSILDPICQESKSFQFALSDAFMSFLKDNNSLDFTKIYSDVISKLSEAMFARNNNENDNEFNNLVPSTLYLGSIQILLSCDDPANLWNEFTETLLDHIWDQNTFQKLNSTALLYSTLPVDFWAPVTDALKQAMVEHPFLCSNDSPDELFDLLDFEECSQMGLACSLNILLVRFHGLLEHATELAMETVLKTIHQDIESYSLNEKKLLYLQEDGVSEEPPYLPRYQSSSSYLLLEATQILYDALALADIAINGKFCSNKTIADLFYFVKYKMIGDQNRDYASNVIRKLKSTTLLQSMRLIHSTDKTRQDPLYGNGDNDDYYTYYITCDKFIDPLFDRPYKRDRLP
ncbi:hypothetical protein ACOME3_008143 [Neoechinorhynchus agilis]